MTILHISNEEACLKWLIFPQANWNRLANWSNAWVTYNISKDIWDFFNHRYHTVRHKKKECLFLYFKTIYRMHCMFARKIQEALDSDLYVPLISRPNNIFGRGKISPRAVQSCQRSSSWFLLPWIKSLQVLCWYLWLNLMRSRVDRERRGDRLGTRAFLSFLSAIF